MHDVRRSHICAASALASRRAKGLLEARHVLAGISELGRSERSPPRRSECARFILSVRKRTWIDLAGRGPSVSEQRRASGIHARNGPKPAGSAVHSVSSGASRCSYYLRHVSQWQMVMMISSIVLFYSSHELELIAAHPSPYHLAASIVTGPRGRSENDGSRPRTTYTSRLRCHGSSSNPVAAGETTSGCVCVHISSSASRLAPYASSPRKSYVM